MCIIVDTNRLEAVFNTASSSHQDFKPIHDWIYNGTGKVIFGGTKYINELSRTRYLRIFLELRKKQKAIKLNDEEVDSRQAIVETLVVHPDFDDPHLVAMVYVSKCGLVCTAEKRAIEYLKNKDFYNKRLKKVSIYSKLSNSSLLLNHNLKRICLQCH